MKRSLPVDEGHPVGPTLLSRVRIGAQWPKWLWRRMFAPRMQADSPAQRSVWSLPGSESANGSRSSTEGGKPSAEPGGEHRAENESQRPSEPGEVQINGLPAGPDRTARLPSTGDERERQGAGHLQNLAPTNGSGQAWQVPRVGDILENSNELDIQGEDLRQRATVIEKTLEGFGVPVSVVEINQGPAVTQFGLRPGTIVRKNRKGEEKPIRVRVAQIQSLANDLALALSASPLRIEAPVPGKDVVGVEVPNTQISLVSLRGVMESEEFQVSHGSLVFRPGTRCVRPGSRDRSGAHATSTYCRCHGIWQVSLCQHHYHRPAADPYAGQLAFLDDRPQTS